MKNQQLYNKVLGQAFLLLKFRPRSEKEIEQKLRYYLQKHNIESNRDIISEVIKVLKESRLIDDISFTRFWIQGRMSGKTRGKAVIFSELMQKGINKELIEEEMVKIEKVYPEEEAILKLAIKAQDKYRNIAGFEKKQKIIAYIIRRGFSYDKTRRVIDEVSKKT